MESQLPALRDEAALEAAEIADGEIVEEPTPEENRRRLLDALRRRRDRMQHEGHIDNSSLYAGSPMYYYCKYCGVETDVLPEGWWASPPKHICADCQTLIELGWHDGARPQFPCRGHNI